MRTVLLALSTAAALGFSGIAAGQTTQPAGDSTGSGAATGAVSSSTRHHSSSGRDARPGAAVRGDAAGARVDSGSTRSRTVIDMRAGGGDVKVRRHRHSVVRYEERSPSVTVVAKKRYAKKRTRIYSSAPVRSRTTVVERRKPAAVVRSRTTIQRTVDEPRSSVRVRDETGGVSARTTTRSRTTTTTTEGRSGSAGGASTSTTGSGGAAATVGGSAGSGR